MTEDAIEIWVPVLPTPYGRLNARNNLQFLMCLLKVWSRRTVALNIVLSLITHDIEKLKKKDKAHEISGRNSSNM